ncbi:transcriptional regulator TbsP [Halococcus sp. AFM35]|uniref:transcriptional regulator TbsP n=1 Tax=Halococcus sp. AFM35 TaxID=3421653 RepID=UPI003EB69AEC
MTISGSRVGPSVVENLQTILAEASGEIIIVGFDEDATGDLVEILAESEDPPNVRLLVDEDVLKWLRDDFVLASTAAELLEAERLDMRAVAPEQLDGELVVTEEAVVSLLTPDDDQSAALVTDDREFVTAVRECWSGVWEESEEFALRTPAYSRVLETLGEEFGSEMTSDFRTVLESVTEMDEGELDEVEVSLLVAAKHEQLLYDISRWGEDTGVASTATFSRTKTRLEEQGVIDTEKVPIDVGRPRLRLLLGDERLREADTEELPSVVRELLSAAPA